MKSTDEMYKELYVELRAVAEEALKQVRGHGWRGNTDEPDLYDMLTEVLKRR